MTAKYVFLRVAEDSLVTTVLLHGDAAQECAQDPAKYAQTRQDGRLAGYWVVPDDIDNAVGADSTHQLFEALLRLGPGLDTHLISDLFATLFEAGYQLGLQAGKE